MTDLSELLRKRSTKVGWGAIVYLVLTMAVVGGGISVFIFQKQLGLLEVQSGRGDAEERLTAQLKANDTSVQRLHDQQATLLRQVGFPIQSLMTASKDFRAEVLTPTGEPHPVNSCQITANLEDLSIYVSIADSITGCLNSRVAAFGYLVMLTNLGFSIVGSNSADWSGLATQVGKLTENNSLKADAHEAYLQERSIGGSSRNLSSKLQTLQRLDADDATEASAGVSTSQNPTLKWVLIQSWITRFEVLALVVFLTGILSALYRYTVRLSHLYAAQADALELAASMDASIEDTNALIRAFMPRIDFGKPPKTPTEEIVEIVRALSPRDR